MENINSQLFLNINLILEKGGDINRALSGASRAGNRTAIEYLIENGADEWNSALFSSAMGGNTELVYSFIDKGANDWNSFQHIFSAQKFPYYLILSHTLSNNQLEKSYNLHQKLKLLPSSN